MESLEQEMADLKSTLNRINANIEKLDIARIGNVDSNTNNFTARRTAQERLSRRYLRLVLTVLIAAMTLTPLLYFFTPGSPTMRITIMAAYASIMMFGVFADGSLWLKSQEIDLQRLPVNDVIDRFLHLRRLHLTYQAILLPFALGFIALIGVNAAETDPGSLFAIIIGAIVGASFGFRIFRKIMRDYRMLTTY